MPCQNKMMYALNHMLHLASIEAEDLKLHSWLLRLTDSNTCEEMMIVQASCVI